ncbi:MAG: hypothetical protein ACO3FE_01885 [Planctomycetaceae bacterium]
MSLAPQQIERIVREVLAEIQGQRSLSARASAAAGTSAQHAPSAGSSPLVLTASVISESVLQQAGAAGKSVAIPATAILTPSGRDYIRRNSVAIQAAAKNSASGHSGVFVIDQDSQAARAAAGSTGWAVEEVSGSADAAAKCRELLQTARVICTTAVPAVTACLLNRSAASRVAVVTRGENIEELIRVMNPQAVCLTTAGWSFSELLQLARQLQPTNSPPQSWRELSGGGPA